MQELFATGEFCLSLIIEIKIYKHLCHNECIFLIFFSAENIFVKNETF